MNKNYFLLLLIVIVGCKRNNLAVSSVNTSFIAFSFFENPKLKIDTVLINRYNNPELKAFYKIFSNETVWDSKENRNFILAEIAKAESEGMEPKDYHYSLLQSYEANYEKLSDSTLVLYDLLLTSNTQLYIRHLSSGKLNPKKLYNDWDIKDKNTDINSVLVDGFNHSNFEKAIANCRPKHLMYQKLKKALQLLDQFPEDTKIGLINLKEHILPNKKSRYIPIIKKRLMYWNDMQIKDTILSQLYDKNTQDAVKVFQARHGLKPDAVIGRGTIEALNFYKSQRREQIIANMERWRWFANNFGNNYLLINIPDYTVVAVKNNDTLQQQRVVVGKDTRKTPILESKISNINLNPNWTVPPTILKEDIYPEAEKDRGVFRQKGLVILNNKYKEVNPYEWKREDAHKYKYVQNPEGTMLWE